MACLLLLKFFLFPQLADFQRTGWWTHGRGQCAHTEKLNWEVFLEQICLGDSWAGGLQWIIPSTASLSVYFHIEDKLLYFAKNKKGWWWYVTPWLLGQVQGSQDKNHVCSLGLLPTPKQVSHCLGLLYVANKRLVLPFKVAAYNEWEVLIKSFYTERTICGLPLP